jgi:hypothetical protein
MIKVKWVASSESGEEQFDEDDIGMSFREFNTLTVDNQEEILREFLDGLPERIYPVIDSWSNDLKS